MENPKEQGQRIAKLRDKTYLSRRAFGLKYNISPATLRSWEDGLFQNLSKNALEKLIIAFKNENIEVDPDWILYGTGVEPSKGIPKKISKTISKESKKEIEISAVNYRNLHQLNFKLFSAAENNDCVEVERLILQGATGHKIYGRNLLIYNSMENTPLHIAALINGINLIKLFITENVTLNSRNRSKQTPLHLAVSKSNVEAIEILLQAGAIIDAVDNDGGTPFSWATYLGLYKIAKLLFENNANIFHSDMYGNTPLHWACYSGKIDIIEFLIEKGAKLEVENSEKQTPLDLAVLNGHIETVDFLLKFFN